MRYIKLLVASVLLVSVVGCVSDNQSDLGMLGFIKTINIVGPDEIAFDQLGGVDQTKATFISNGSALVFNWAVGDTLGIFPNKGNQVEFPITAQEGSTSASFDGGGWALRNNASYAAYYPFSVWNYFRNNKTVVMDYSGQVQNGNGSFEHLSAYDFLASAKTTPRNSTVTFQMDRQGSILYIDIVVPEPATITSLTITCNEAIFVEKAALDISGNTPVVTPIETKESLTLSFVNTTTTETNETVRAYMAVQPLDFSSKTVTATLITDADTYTAPVVSRVVNKGKAAFLRFSGSFTESGAQPIPVTNVSLDNSSLTLTSGETASLTATITPSNATQQSVTWLSSNTAVATVDSNGTVTAVDVGTTTITVTTNDGGLTATCEVTVNAEPVIPDDNDYINLSANETANCYIVSEAGSYSFDATIAGNGKCVEWDNVFAPYAYPEYNAITGLKCFSGDGVEVVLNQNNCVSEVSYADGKILFKTTGNEGNAKLTLTNGGARVWTWVIWCTDAPAVLPFSRSGVTYHIMDRNLGAISDGSDSATCEEMSGLYYQFGNPIGYTWEEFNQGVCINRREEDMDGATATMKKALADNPNCPNLNCIGEPFSTGDYYWFWPYTTNTNGLYGNLWGAGDRQYSDNLKCGYENTKTLYDPCPAGYKVMGWDTFGWDTDAYYQVSYRDVNGLYIPVDGGANLFLPYNGAAWVNVYGEVFWMKKGPKLVYVYNPDDSVCATLWTSGHSGRNLAFCTVRFAVPWDGDDFDYDLYMNSGYGHIVSRGMGVRCIADEDFSGHAGIDNPSIYGGGHEVTSEEAWN
ncbi:MAG: Ig domain-containing protein [Bacteroidales bacterium]|nr:Ig domain-containing protein [Bacteroidales bacterium]